ncbi:MAG: hypothetical protein HJJLKODD_00266 [Phycisphaerae bacterium]|nr:hypothetical protein [Phycisphaerae bacterium]
MIILGAGITTFVFFLFPIAGAMLLFYGIYQAVSEAKSSDKAKIKARLQERSSGSGAEAREKRIRESLLRSRDQQVSNPLFQFMSGFKLVPKLQALLDQANIDMPATKLMTILCGISLGSVPVLLLLQLNPLVAVVVSGLTFLGPIVFLKIKRNRRMKKMVTQLPDVFEMMSQALRAGHSLAGSIQLIADQLPDPAGTEFSRVFHEQNFGLKIEDALMNLANRCDQMDIRFFVTAVLIQRQTGGDLAEILDKISSVIRGRIELLGTVRGLTAEGRLSGWVLFVLPILVFFASLGMNREYAMTLIVDPNGRLMLCVAGMMQLLGMAMIKKIVNIKV